MTRGEAPGGSRPGAFGAIRLADGWGSLQPSWRERSLPHPHAASPAARNRSRWGNRQRHSWGWLAVVHGRETEKTPPLLF